MREILFRGKACDGEWIYGYYAGPAGGRNNFHEIRDNSDSVGAWLDVDPATVGEFTGLKDKKGKRIFEGDILKENRFGEGDKLSVVEFEDGSFGTRSFKAGEFSCCCIPFNDCEFALDTQDNAEVIGNIHDNPELLQEV